MGAEGAKATEVRICELMKHELTQQRQQPVGGVVPGRELVVSVREVLAYFNSDRFFSKTGLAKYLSISTRSIEKSLHAIPHYRLLNSMLIFKKSEIDEWAEKYRENDSHLDQIVDGAIESLK